MQVFCIPIWTVYLVYTAHTQIHIHKNGDRFEKDTLYVQEYWLKLSDQINSHDVLSSTLCVYSVFFLSFCYCVLL